MQNRTRSSKSDDFYTPPSAIRPLAEIIRDQGFRTAWEPACGQGHIITVLEDVGISTVCTDITRGLEYDFRFAEAPTSAECIVTNPPFSLAAEFIIRCMDIGLPWALLLPLDKLDTSRIRPLLGPGGVSLFIINGKPAWIRPDGTTARFGFTFAWYTSGFFPPGTLNFEPRKVRRV